MSPGFGGFAGTLEGGERQNAFGLESDIEDDRVGGNGDYRAFQLFAAVFALMGMALLELREQVAEGLVGLGGGRGFRNAVVGNGWIGHERVTASSGVIPK